MRNSCSGLVVLPLAQPENLQADRVGRISWLSPWPSLKTYRRAGFVGLVVLPLAQPENLQVGKVCSKLLALPLVGSRSEK